MISTHTSTIGWLMMMMMTWAIYSWLCTSQWFGLLLVHSGFTLPNLNFIFYVQQFGLFSVAAAADAAGCL